LFSICFTTTERSGGDGFHPFPGACGDICLRVPLTATRLPLMMSRQTMMSFCDHKNISHHKSNDEETKDI
jgi:hypothetical protein